MVTIQYWIILCNKKKSREQLWPVGYSFGWYSVNVYIQFGGNNISQLTKLTILSDFNMNQLPINVSVLILLS